MICLLTVLLLCLGLAGAPADEAPPAAEIQVAVASNFAVPLRDIAALFKTETGHTVIISAGSTGRHFAQISAGAPFDVFLAADEERPRRLVANGQAVTGSRFTYAIGRLVFYGQLVDAAGQGMLESLAFRHLAIANPRLAPYGRAAQQTLEHLELWNRVQDKLVRGQNVGQTWQFILSGNAELGLVSLAQVKAHAKADKPLQEMMIVPTGFHDPIRQQAVLLSHAVDKAAARAFLKFLQSPAAMAVIMDYGYILPPKGQE